MGERTTGEPSPYKRLTVAQAADQLGINEGAVRSRIKRGTLATERVGGAVYVVIADEPSADQTSNAGGPSDEPRSDVDQRLIEAYEARLGDKDERIESLERQLRDENEARRRADHIIAALTERIPELEAPPQTPQEAQEAAESASEGESREEDAEERTEDQSAGSEERVPWWRRLFGRG